MSGGEVSKRIWLPIVVFVVVSVIAMVVYAVWRTVARSVVVTTDQTKQQLESVPEIDTQIIATGLDNVWDIAFTPDNENFFITERGGDISLMDKNGQKKILGHPSDVVAVGEGGLMGMAIDPDFNKNQYIYTCFSTADDIRVVRWKVKTDESGLEDRTDIITGIPTNKTGQTGRHSGCRPRFGIDGYLWIGTGDAATSTNPQDPQSLGGKILRVDRDGKFAPDNMSEPFDARIYSYGHRNTQGLAFRPKAKDGVIGYSAEHGPGTDDEINVLRRGNFGWDPGVGYDEAVPMTDLTKFPEAIESVWSSGTPTLALSGAAIISGPKWRSWNGALAVAMLKTKHLHILTFDSDGKVESETKILDDYGRLRAVTHGPDGSLYIGTSNGGAGDKILKITPK